MVEHIFKIIFSDIPLSNIFCWNAYTKWEINYT